MKKFGMICFKCGNLGHKEGDCRRSDWVMIRACHSPKVLAYEGGSIRNRLSVCAMPVWIS